jgi:hypothetical protein
MAGAENACQLCSRFEKILNVPRGYASGFFSPAAALAAVLNARFTDDISS